MKFSTCNFCHKNYQKINRKAQLKIIKIKKNIKSVKINQNQPKSIKSNHQKSAKSERNSKLFREI